MSATEYFFWMAEQAASFGAAFWYVSITAALVGLYAAFRMFRDRPLTSGAVAVLVLGVLNPFVALLVGILFRGEGISAHAASDVLGLALFALPIVTGIACVVRAPRQRRATALFAGAASWPFFLAYVIAGMSIANDSF